MEYLNSAPEVLPVHHKKEHTNSVQVVGFNPEDINQFFSGSHDMTAKIWDLNTFKPTKTVTDLE